MKAASLILRLLFFGLLASVCIAAESADRRWCFDVSGQMDGLHYWPHDDSTFLDFGSQLVARLESPHHFDYWFLLTFRTQAGYFYSDNPNAPRTPVDLLHQIWWQGLGVTARDILPVPAHLVLIRYCNHMLDKSGFDPQLWTDALIGTGTFTPWARYEDMRSEDRRVQVKWFAGGGPTLRGHRRNMWTTNSPVRAEGMADVFAAKSLWSWGRVDALGEVAVQSSSVEPHLRHALKSEVGLLLHSERGGWRFFVGQRWRDTRVLWPADQRTYAGLEFIF